MQCSPWSPDRLHFTLEWKKYLGSKTEAKNKKTSIRTPPLINDTREAKRRLADKTLKKKMKRSKKNKSRYIAKSKKAKRKIQTDAKRYKRERKKDKKEGTKRDKRGRGGKKI